MNVFNIEQSYRQYIERGWQHLYLVVDLHGTLIKPYHNCIEYYPHALEVLRWFNNQKEFKVILWTSSHIQEIKNMLVDLAMHDVTIDYVNANPNQPSSDRADFSKKFYFNILLDDKAGFDPETDWLAIKNELVRLGKW